MNLRIPALQRRLAEAGPVAFVAVAGLVAFTAYGCVYALRKPFTAASFEGLSVWGVQYKIALVIAQVAGYALSKFVGIALISALGAARRAALLLGLVGVALLSLLGFALSPAPWGVFWMFLNGFPLGMTWGVVFGYLEGRRATEVLAALLCVNFILSSGFVKTVGQWLMLSEGVSEFWMPLAAGLLFLPALLGCVWLLEHLPPPSADDRASRSERTAMSGAERSALFWRYAPGLMLLTAVYLVLTVVRDVRDNFAVELWAELGMGNQPAVLTAAELPIALLILLCVGAMALVKSNFLALRLNHLAFIGGALLTAGATLLFRWGWLPPFGWMVLSGTGVFLAYILFNGVVFERLIAAFQERGNVGFLIYLADSIGYLGSVLVLLWRNFGRADLSWVRFFSGLCLYGSALVVLLSLLSWRYFERRHAAR
jgi:hypothetical protein